MRVNPSDALGALSLELALVQQFSAQMIEVQGRVESWSQDQLGLQLQQLYLVLLLADLVVALARHCLHFLDRLVEIGFLLALSDHVLPDGLQQQAVALEPGDGRLDECCPVETLGSFVLSDHVKELSEDEVSVGFLANQERGVAISGAVFNVDRPRLADPFSEQVTKANNPGALLLLPVLELG